MKQDAAMLNYAPEAPEAPKAGDGYKP